MKLFDERDNFITEVEDTYAEKLVAHGAARFSKSKGNRPRKIVKLLPPPPPPSDSHNSATTITLREILVNAWPDGVVRSYQQFCTGKVAEYGAKKSWADRVVYV